MHNFGILTLVGFDSRNDTVHMIFYGLRIVLFQPGELYRFDTKGRNCRYQQERQHQNDVIFEAHFGVHEDGSFVQYNHLFALLTI